MHITSREIILSHCCPMSKRPERHLSRSSFRSSPQVPVCKTHDWSQTKQAITDLTASINHLPSGIRAEEEEIKRRKTNSNVLAQMFYQQNQTDGSQYCLLFLVCAASDMALQENSSPSKMYLVNPLCISISHRKQGLLCMQVLNGIRLLQVSVSSLLLSGRAGGAEQHGTESCHGFQLSTAFPHPWPILYYGCEFGFTTSTTQNNQSPLAEKYTVYGGQSRGQHTRVWIQLCFLFSL